MIPYGHGFCEVHSNISWTAPRFKDKEDCKQLCRMDGSCSYVSFKEGQSCTRYNTLVCHLSTDTKDNLSHYTYKKIDLGKAKS